MSAWEEFKAGWREACKKDALLLIWVFAGTMVVVLGHCIIFGVAGFTDTHPILDRRFWGEAFIMTAAFFLGRASIAARDG